MPALLLPVKDLNNAKKRLMGVLTTEERFALSGAMLADTIRAPRGVRCAEKVFVVTNCEPVMQLAEENRWEILWEEQQISESHSVDAASRICEQRSVTGLLRLPLDLPLIQSSDIDELLTVECQAPALVIVPSRDGTGTNAMMRTPPTLFPSHFGSGSFAKHLAEAERTHARVMVCRNARLEIVVLHAADLLALMEHINTTTESGRWLRASGVEAKFLRNSRAGAMSAR